MTSLLGAPVFMHMLIKRNMVLGVTNMELDVENVSFTVSDVEIIKSISLKVKEGQFVGIIGPNGCGKSTLLKTFIKS